MERQARADGYPMGRGDEGQGPAGGEVRAARPRAARPARQQEVTQAASSGTAIPIALRRLHRASALLNRALAAVAGVALVAVTFFTVADVVMRFFGRPIAGSFEVIGWLSAVSLALALGYTQGHRGHVAVTLVTDLLRGRSAAFLDALNSLAALVLFGLVAWVLVRYGQTLQESGSLSETLK